MLELGKPIHTFDAAAVTGGRIVVRRARAGEELVTLDHVTRTLLNALTQGRIAHGYIFSGHRGIGKTTIAVLSTLNKTTPAGIAPAARRKPLAYSGKR